MTAVVSPAPGGYRATCPCPWAGAVGTYAAAKAAAARHRQDHRVAERRKAA